MSRRRFTKEFKLAAVRRLEAGESGSALARELEVKREKLYDWLAQVERYGVVSKNSIGPLKFVFTRDLRLTPSGVAPQIILG